MKAERRKGGWRGLWLGLLGGLVLLAIGDRGAQTAPPPGLGIDPFEVLDLQIKNNVLIVLDTSGSMRWPSDEDDFPVGSDDPASRMYQLKQAVKAVVNANQTKVNFGLATYNILATQKTLLRNADDDNDSAGAPDGPFIYVSADAAAAPFYNAGQGCAGIDGFFCQISALFANYDQNTSSDIYRGFSNRQGGNGSAFDDPYPNLCTPGVGQLDPVIPSLGAGMRCRYYLQSRTLRRNVLYRWDRTQGTIANRLVGAPINIVCPAPPVGLLGYTNTAPHCFQFQDVATAGQPISTFYYSSPMFQQNAGTNSCGGGALLNQVAPCAGNNGPVILTAMDPEIPVCAAVGASCPAIGALRGVPWPPPATYAGSAVGGAWDYGDGHLEGDNVLGAAIGGLRSGQSTPLERTLTFIRTAGAPAFPPLGAPNQKNFVIMLTDGDDTCGSAAEPSGTALDRNAVLAAEAAEQLYNGPDFQHKAETLLVAFAAAINPARANVIGQGGSGRVINGGAPTPATALGACTPGGACRNAFFAQNTQELIDVLNAAITQAASSGLFSASASVFDIIPEYVMSVDNPLTPVLPPNDYSPLDPEERYSAFAFRTYRASFEVAGFKGFVRAFDRNGAIPGWEAGQLLLNRISPDLATVDHTFVGLLDTPSAPIPPGACSGAPSSPCTHINRRIFTSSQNGIAPARVNLWPPDAAVAPTLAATPGSLDEPLFRKPDGTQMVLADMQAAPWRACLGANLPASCPSLAGAKKEMREMILAYMAGAEAQRDAGGNPLRVAGEIQYRTRTWVLSESTLSTPAVVTPPVGPPLDAVPTEHTAEYQLYLNGPRDQSTGVAIDRIDDGYGLRHPDRDGDEDPNGAQKNRPALKPVMSVVYIPSNDMLHAFRAGPSCGQLTPPGCPENGGEELWAYVPYDLLPVLKDRLKAQSRVDHTFMMAASIRFADVFVPTPAPFVIEGITYTGNWRKILLTGRGIGGKYYSALDITAPGPFTRAVLNTQLPTILWNRGNPDTNNGLATTHPTSPGTPIGSPTDLAAYATMGQTWSTPVIARLQLADRASSLNKEFVAYMGSGYGVTFNPGTKVYDPVPGTGTTFYTLDPLTGQVLASSLIPDAAGATIPNALIANPSIYVPDVLKSGGKPPNFAGADTESAFIGDLHGRMWKFGANTPATRALLWDAGVEQPIAVASALLNLQGPGARLAKGRAAVFFEAGYDARITPVTPFKAYAVDDTTPPALLLNGNSIDLVSPVVVAGKGPYRGTLQPVTAFRRVIGGASEPVVFFAATRFNPISGTSCISSFDTIIFGLSALIGGNAYALQEYDNVKAVGLPRAPVPPVVGDPAPVDHGHADATCTGPDCPPPSLPPQDSPGLQVSVVSKGFRSGSQVCR